MKWIAGLAAALSLSAAMIDGAKINWATSGQGEKIVVFVHGWTCDSTTWSKQVPAVARKYQAVTLDLPGHGKSGMPKGQFSMDLFAKAIEGVRRDVHAGDPPVCAAVSAARAGAGVRGRTDHRFEGGREFRGARGSAEKRHAEDAAGIHPRDVYPGHDSRVAREDRKDDGRSAGRGGCRRNGGDVGSGDLEGRPGRGSGAGDLR